MIFFSSSSSFRKEVGLDLFFPKQMQENLKVKEAVVKGPGKTLLMLCPRTRAEGTGLGILGDTARVSVLLGAIGT